MPGLLCSVLFVIASVVLILPACDRQTDRQRELLYQYHRVHSCTMLTRGKK